MHPHRLEIPSPVVPSSPADPAWDEAFIRVESYIRAHHLEGRLLLNEVVTSIIREARETKAAEESPVVAAMRVTHRRIGHWFWRAGYEGDWADARVRARGRLGLLLGDLPGRWSAHFLAEEPVPAELAAALVSGVLKPGPEVRLTNMPSAPLEFGFTDPVTPNARRTSAWVMLREAAAWIAVVGVFGVAWAASH